MDLNKSLVIFFVMGSLFVAIATAEDAPEDAVAKSYEGLDVENAPNETNDLQNVAKENSTITDSPKSMPGCRMGYGVMSSYPIEEGYYNHQTCFWCYFFTPAHRKKYNLQLKRDKIILSDGKARMDFKFMSENQTYYFDPDDEEGWLSVTSSLSDVLEAAKLEACCREAVTCCQRNLNATHKQDESSGLGDAFCPATWDGWSCFSDTPAGETVSFVCPAHAHKGQPECALKGQKTCWANGTWARDSRGIEQTEYAMCSHQHYHLVNYYWEVSMHAISMASLIPALIILPYYKPLRAQRFVLHLNLFWALFFKAFFKMLDIALIRIPEYTETNKLMDDNTGGCKFLTFLTKFFGVAVWSWMLSESLYLHRLIVAAFKGKGKTFSYVLIGWVIPVVLCVPWAITRAMLEDYQCWLGDQHGDSRHLYLITELPKLVILVVNAILLANMTRVLVSQMKTVSDDTALANKKALKATMFLLPMFGLQFFITFVVPPQTTPCAGMHVYFFLATAVDGLQGLYVVVVYCYINQEVKTQVIKSMHHLSEYRQYTTVTYDPATEVSHIHSSVNHSVAS